MGRGKSRDKYTSKGERRNVSKRWTKILRLERKENEGLYNQFDAYLKGKNVVLTVPNPLKSETHKPFIKIKAKQYWRRASSE